MSIFRPFTLVMLCWFSASASAQSIEPAPDWQTAESAHFKVNYRSAWRVQAERVVLAAERAYPKVTKALDWEPRKKTEILLIDQYDLPNGYATPTPFNTIGIFLAPPDEGQLLDNSNWLDLLMTHEFTHTVHLDQVRSMPTIFRNLFGRDPLFFPNIFQPRWAIEGLAVYNESEIGTGRGRLQGPVFEAWLRAEAKSGFLSLAEINSEGRALPPSKAYLYGAYFYEFLARRYGQDAIFKQVEKYSSNFPFWPRLHTSPLAATGKTMDVLWDEYLVDLKAQVQQRAEHITTTRENVGERISDTLFGINSIAALPDGTALAVIDDGLHHARLVKIARDGTQTKVSDINRNAQLNVAPNGQVLVTQPDICNDRYNAYDLYRLDASGNLNQLTHCARLRHAVQAGDAIVALQQSAGITRLLVLDAQGKQQRVLKETSLDINLIDLAASPDGKQISVVSKQAGNWRVEAYDLTQPETAPRLLLTADAPIHGLKHGTTGLEFIAVRDGVFNVWRLDGDALVRLSHTHTRVTAQGGTQPDGSLLMAVVTSGGYALQRMPVVAPLQRMPVTLGSAVASTTPEPSSLGNSETHLGVATPYQSWRTIAPQSWFPMLTGDSGLTAIGASVFGADALGWHQYAASLQLENTQRDWQGTLQYMYDDRHSITLQRQLQARAWKNGNQLDGVTSYDIRNTAQWKSVLPFIRNDRRITLGVGAAIDTSERVNPQFTNARLAKDNKIIATFLDYNTSGGNWWSEGRNRGQQATLLFETYGPLARTASNDYDGNVLRFDWRGYVPLGRTVLALRHTEVKANGYTERFQLGGAIDNVALLGATLNNRDIAFRGYSGDEPGQYGANARLSSIEWRTPIADVDRHLMTPAVGINRLSGSVFFEMGGAWDKGNGPTNYNRSVGVEVLGEFKLFYQLGLQLRFGVAHALDQHKDTVGYISLGRAF